MKVGIRKPSIKKSIKARTTGKAKRKLKKAVNPLYGKKGMGMIRNPKKAMYNKVYNKTTVDSRKLVTGSKKKARKSTTTRATPTKARSSTNRGSAGVGVVAVILFIACAYAFLPLAIIILIVAGAYYAYKYFKGQGQSDQETEGEMVVEASEPTEDELHRQYFENEDIQDIQKKYYDLLERVEAEYRRLNNGEGFAGQAGDNLVDDCRMGIELSKCLVDVWNTYQEPIPRIPFYYRLAIVYEKRCEYDNAIRVCVDAIRAGQADDGTKGGMSARIQRLAKKGSITLDEDTLALLQ